MYLAVKEISRALKSDGKLVIVDLGKPDTPLKRWIIGIWWRFLVPLITVVTAKRKGLFYKVLYATYEKLPRNGELKRILSLCFGEVEFRSKMLGGLVIVTAKKSEQN
jgi:demethylmenaquinone methyltransferase/2-methoxy-6-polyprenyl-1,4-benzoquinol methylase